MNETRPFLSFISLDLVICTPFLGAILWDSEYFVASMYGKRSSKEHMIGKKDIREYDSFYKANFAILVSILRDFYFVCQKIGAPSHCKVLWHIPSQERGHHKSDPGNGKVQR